MANFAQDAVSLLISRFGMEKAGELLRILNTPMEVGSQGWKDQNVLFAAIAANVGG